jgi:hypothetical protein
VTTFNLEQTFECFGALPSGTLCKMSALQGFDFRRLDSVSGDEAPART